LVTTDNFDPVRNKVITTSWTIFTTARLIDNVKFKHANVPNIFYDYHRRVIKADEFFLYCTSDFSCFSAECYGGIATVRHQTAGLHNSDKGTIAHIFSDKGTIALKIISLDFVTTKESFVLCEKRQGFQLQFHRIPPGLSKSVDPRLSDWNILRVTLEVH
jgi:hypothetical protein